MYSKAQKNIPWVPYNKDTFNLDYLKSKKMSDKQRLFQYAVILHKYTQTETNNGKMYDGAEIIVDPTFVMAASEKEVVFKATRKVPEDKAGDPDNVEIIVRPF